MPSSPKTSRTRTRGPRAASAPSSGHRGPASVCKQTGHVAPAASSPPPAPVAPTETPRPILTRPCWAESAAPREMGPEGPRDRCPVLGARRSRCQRAPCPRALGLRRAPICLPGCKLHRPARARLGSTGMRRSKGPPGRIPGSGRSLKATVSAAAAAATLHPSGSGLGAAL